MSAWEDTERCAKAEELRNGVNGDGATLSDGAVRVLEAHLASKPVRRNAAANAIVRALRSVTAQTVVNGIRASGMSRVWDAATRLELWNLAHERDASGALWSKLTPRGMPLAEGVAAEATPALEASESAGAGAGGGDEHQRGKERPREQGAKQDRTCGWCGHTGHDRRNCLIHKQGLPAAKGARYK